jgi:micrococcal nuclease
MMSQNKLATTEDLLHFYLAQVLRVVDGDTIKVSIDCGFGVRYETMLRLWGVNCPEVRGESKAQGALATKFAVDWLAEHAKDGRVFIKSHDGREIHQEKYGRWLAVVMPTDIVLDESIEPESAWGRSLNQALLGAGMAVLM